MIYLEGDREHGYFSKQLEPNRYRGISVEWAGWAIAQPFFGRIEVTGEKRRRGGQRRHAAQSITTFLPALLS